MKGILLRPVQPQIDTDPTVLVIAEIPVSEEERDTPCLLKG